MKVHGTKSTRNQGSAQTRVYNKMNAGNKKKNVEKIANIDKKKSLASEIFSSDQVIDEYHPAVLREHLKRGDHLN